jgi:1-acyl-sn-glycerol-3-phosphate acyltransferase
VSLRTRGVQRWSVLLPERSDGCNQPSCAFGGPMTGLSPDEGRILNQAPSRYTARFRKINVIFLPYMLFAFRMVVMALYFVLASLLNLVIVFLRPFNTDNSRWCGQVYGRPVLRLFGLQVHRELEALESTAHPYVIVANHQSNHDLFLHGTVVPRATVSIGKTSLKWMPLFGQIYWLAGSVLIDRGNASSAKQSMLQTTEVMQQHKTSIWVFAEGTRNHGKGLKPFKKGAFQMAISAGVPIVPVCASTYRRSMRLHRWRAGHIIVRALPPIPTEGLTLDDMPTLMAQCHVQMQHCIAELDARVAELDNTV